ncbi:CMP-N-acetylneuraminate-poly-alpha-2,8-sialyltransferase-like [Lytechinus variegatus]|uniref:CMP-N-acetylneuraminate-poly-alpha-2, 8-sialyltransferase-like n=1 Tax=Lytechinus variegatus TaxID=7654 RepID=UPI001BB12703|nr:CMP-N-acetylneuraminate-poly-alpha-2,8-sialyltransferase-like [Lytechinus variegatus]
MLIKNLWRRTKWTRLTIVVTEITLVLVLWYLNCVKFYDIVRHNGSEYIKYEPTFEELMSLYQTTIHQANLSDIPPPSRRRAQLMKPLSVDARENARSKIMEYLNTSTTFRIFRRDIEPQNFKFGVNLTTILHQNQTDVLPSPVGHRCAVVGNSGILLSSLCGHEIDDYDFVFRLNLAPVDGEFTRDVGAKVDLITLNKMELVQLAKLSTGLKTQKEGWMYINRLNFITNKSIIWYPKGFPDKLSKIAVSFRDTLYLQPAWAYSPESLMYLASRVWKIPVPSTGLSVMTAALLHCDEVTMYGFYPFPKDTRGRPLRYHYYEPNTGPFYSKGNSTIGVHRMPKEFALLQQLAVDGVLRLVTERCYEET